jgi:molybdopterin converting factor small subunit
MPIIKIPSPLQSYVGNQRSIIIRGSSIEEVILNLTKAHPDIKPQIIDPEGLLRPFITIFLQDKNTKDLKEGLRTPVKEDDNIVIIASMAGG